MNETRTSVDERLSAIRKRLAIIEYPVDALGAPSPQQVMAAYRQFIDEDVPWLLERAAHCPASDASSNKT